VDVDGVEVQSGARMGADCLDDPVRHRDMGDTIPAIGLNQRLGLLGAIVGWLIGLAAIAALWQRSASDFFRDPLRY
jgi:hypothetical protein